MFSYISTKAFYSTKKLFNNVMFKTSSCKLALSWSYTPFHISQLITVQISFSSNHSNSHNSLVELPAVLIHVRVRYVPGSLGVSRSNGLTTAPGAKTKYKSVLYVTKTKFGVNSITYIGSIRFINSNSSASRLDMKELPDHT